MHSPDYFQWKSQQPPRVRIPTGHSPPPSNPLSMKQPAWWMPDVPAGAQRVCSNDVYVDHRGLIYLIDRNRGLSLLERV
ncbi:MAG: hypothetical protein QOE49_3878 [Rhodospirillaceae bacterium]|jgi:hypothetical protein|nr:hypothetical protein [Rhodospirillaceae bacterium]